VVRWWLCSMGAASRFAMLHQTRSLCQDVLQRPCCNGPNAMLCTDCGRIQTPAPAAPGPARPTPRRTVRRKNERGGPPGSRVEPKPYTLNPERRTVRRKNEWGLLAHVAPCLLFVHATAAQPERPQLQWPRAGAESYKRAEVASELVRGWTSGKVAPHVLQAHSRRSLLQVRPLPPLAIL
jgi:hypothetical protein